MRLMTSSDQGGSSEKGGEWAAMRVSSPAELFHRSLPLSSLKTVRFPQSRSCSGERRQL